MAATIRVDNIRVSRGGKQVIHGISFEVSAGTITTLLGANGAGKSSTVMAMSGVLPLAEGRVGLGNLVLTGMPPDRVRRRGIALVPEGHRVLGQLSVEENLQVAGLVASKVGAGLSRVYEIFPELNERRRQRASDLSGGQKQMVAMGQAFMAAPDFMFVDELSLGLAPTVVRRLMEALRVAAGQGIGVLLIEQFANIALDLASKALVLERGRIVYDGPSSTLRDQPEILHGAYLAQ
jgi:branched-chain amino acid transport system ATP-binding protein